MVTLRKEKTFALRQICNVLARYILTGVYMWLAFYSLERHTSLLGNILRVEG